MLYELAPGVLIRTGSDDPAGGRHVLSEKQLGKARADYEARPTKKTHAAIAERLHATVYEPVPPANATALAVDPGALIAALGVEKTAELTGLTAAQLEQLQN